MERKSLFHRNIVVALLFCFINILFIAACTHNADKEKSSNQPVSVKEEKQVVHVLAPKVPSLIPLLYAANQENDFLSLHVDTWDTLEQLLVSVQDEKTPLVIAPINIGANVAAKGLPLQLLHVNVWGSLYLVSTSPNVKEMTDLVNEKVYIPGQGGPPDLLTKYVLGEYGLTNNVELVHLPSVPEIMQLLASGEIQNAVLPEPVLSGLRVQKEDLHEVIDYEKVWKELFNTSLPLTGTFINMNWAKEHPEQVERFHQLYENSLNRVLKDPKEALQLSAEVFGLPQSILEMAMSHIQLGYKSASEAKEEIEHYLEILMQINPESIGGNLPDDQFYYTP